MPVLAKTNPGPQNGVLAAINYQPRRTKQWKPLSVRGGLIFELPSDSLPSLQSAPRSAVALYPIPTNKRLQLGQQSQLRECPGKGQACFVCKRLSEGNYSRCFALHPAGGLDYKASKPPKPGACTLILPTAHAQALGKNTCLPLHQRPHPRKAKKKEVGVELV